MHHSTLFLGWQVWQASCFIQILFRAPSRLIITSVNHHHNRHNCPHFLIAIKMMIIAATMIIIINVVDIFRYLDFIQSSPRILQPPSAQCHWWWCGWWEASLFAEPLDRLAALQNCRDELATMERNTRSRMGGSLG